MPKNANADGSEDTPQSEEFCFSIDEETYDGSFATREDALEAAIERVGEETGAGEWCRYEFGQETTVHTGIAVKKHARDFIVGAAEVMIERAQESAYDDAGDHAEDWLSKVSPEQDASLEEMLCAAFETWCKQTGHEPKFWGVEKTQSHDVTAPSEPTEGDPQIY